MVGRVFKGNLSRKFLQRSATDRGKKVVKELEDSARSLKNATTDPERAVAKVRLSNAIQALRKELYVLGQTSCFVAGI